MIGIVGLGLLGTAIARRLLGKGFVVVGYDISPRQLDGFSSAGGRAAGSAAEVAASCRRLVLSLPTTDTVEAVVNDMTGHLRPGDIVVDTTTGEPGRTADLGRRLAGIGVEYLDATISGSSAEALAGSVVVMAGGNAAPFAACEDIFEAFARRWFHVGPWGSGAAMKLVVNLVLGLNRAALAEGLGLARSLDLDLAAALAVMREGAAYSRAMDVKGEKMVQGDFTPQARLAQHLKDVRLMLASAETVGAKLPLSMLHRELLESLVAAGHGELDNSAIVKAFIDQ